MGTLGTIVVVLIGGTIIGLLGKLVGSGPPGQRSRSGSPSLCGIGGMLIGTFLYGALYDNTNTPGIDWWRHVWQVAVAAVLVMLAASRRAGGPPRRSRTRAQLSRPSSAIRFVWFSVSRVNIRPSAARSMPGGRRRRPAAR